MTISSTLNRVSTNGNGATTVFPVSFPFHAQTDLIVLSTVITTGVSTTKVLTTDYTISGTTDSLGHYTNGGNVNFLVAPASTVRITIYRDPTRTQGLDLQDISTFPAESLEAQLDYVTMLTQRVSDLIGRSMRQPDGDNASIGPMPSSVERALMFGAWDANGDPIAAAGTSANLGPVSGFINTLLDDSTAAVARTTLDVPSNAEAILDTLIDAKGDLLVGTAADTVARKAVGADGTGLIALAASADGLYYQPGAIGQPVLIGGHVTVTLAANAVTFAIKTTAGNNPSTTEPVWSWVRSATLTDALPVLVKITAATSLVISSGSTFGTINAIASRIYYGILNNAGTVELCAWNSVTTTGLFAWSESVLISTTAEGGAGAADSAGVIYSTTARANVAARYAGFFESTQTTAGTWAQAVTVIQQMGPGIRRTNDLVQTRRNYTGAVASGSTVMPWDDTTPQITEGDEYMTQAIVPTSNINQLRIEHLGNYNNSLNLNTSMALFQDATANALAATWAFMGESGVGNEASGPIILRFEMAAGTTSSTTFRIRAGTESAATVTFNGSGAARKLGGVLASLLQIEEIFA